MVKLTVRKPFNTSWLSGWSTMSYNRTDWNKRKRYSWFIEPMLDKQIRTYIQANSLKDEEFYNLRADHQFTDNIADAFHILHGVGPHDMNGKEIKIGDKLLIGSANCIAIGNVSRIKTTPNGVAVYRRSDPYQIQILITEHTYKGYIGKKSSAGRPERMLLL